MYVSPKFVLPKTRDELIFTAKLAEQAERYGEMVQCMKAVVHDSAKLSQDERNLLSVAYKNSIGSLRAPWRILTSIEQREEQKQSGNAAKVCILCFPPFFVYPFKKNFIKTPFFCVMLHDKASITQSVATSWRM